MNGLDALGFVAHDARRDVLEQLLGSLLARYGSLSMRQLRDMDTAEIVEDLEALLYGEHFRLPYQFAFLGRAVATLAGLVTRTEQSSLTAPMPGTVVKVLVADGDRVEPRQPLVVLEAMKMETPVVSPYEAVVRGVHVREGDRVSGGALLVELEE